MRKLFSMLTLAIFALALTSCGDKDKNEPKPELHPIDTGTEIIFKTFGMAGVLTDKKDFNLGLFHGLNVHKKWVTSVAVYPDASKIILDNLKPGVKYSDVEIYLEEKPSIKLVLGTLEGTESHHFIPANQSYPFIDECMKELVNTKRDMHLVFKVNSDTDIKEDIVAKIIIKAKFLF